MSNFLKFFWGNGGNNPKNLPKASVSTNYSFKNELKLPISSMESQNFRFNILFAHNKEVVLLKKTIFRILGLIKQSFYNKKGLVQTKKKKSSKLLDKSKKSLSSNNLFQSPNEFISRLDLQILMNADEGFFSNEKALQKFAEGYENPNLMVYYSSSSSTITMLLKKTVFYLCL